MIGELSENDSVLKHLTIGTKYLECVTNGNITIPATQAFGTWEFDIFRPSGNIEIELSGDVLNKYTDNVGTGYWFLFYSNSKTYFPKKVAGAPTQLMITASNYMVINTWYSIRITRDIKGIFTLWVKGGAFGDTWTLISATDGGTNPTAADLTLTKSNGMSLSLSAGCCVANLKFYDGVRQ